MASITRARLIIAAALAVACLFHVERPAAQDGSLAGQFLIASPSMGDPRFQRTVILMVRHDRNGAFGIVINKPVGERPRPDILGADDKEARGTVKLHYGGPVEPQAGFVIHSANSRRANTVDIDAQVAITSSREILHDIGRGTGPGKSLIAFGYAGWAPGQLEGEIAGRAWYVSPATQSLIFDEDREKVWDIATSHRTQDL